VPNSVGKRNSPPDRGRRSPTNNFRGKCMQKINNETSLTRKAPIYTKKKIKKKVEVNSFLQMESARAAIRFENEIMAKNPDPEPLLTDWIHGVYLFSHLFANALKSLQ
jgi:hypothetical protein